MVKEYFFFFNTHIGYPIDFIFVFHRHVMGGIPPPSRGIVGKNRSTHSKTTVRSKRVGPLGVYAIGHCPRHPPFRYI